MKKLIYLCLTALAVTACARMGNPDGGWYDDTPPYVVGSTPGDLSTDVRPKRVSIYFNEFIKLEDAQNKVIISPPQLEMPEIKATGKRVVVDLKDSLKENTTYTIDFGDAISDFTEGNPMGNYAFTFSTGKVIDTLQVSGYVLNAENLEPVKGIQVGLYDDLSDTAFQKKPMMRISRTDSRGHFVIKGVAPGTYRCYALQDADNNYVYNQKSEMIGFSHDTFEPSWKPDTRQDTIWRDSLHIDNILRVPFTHFLPDDITLLAFTSEQTNRYLLKTERTEPQKIGFYFTYGDSVPPTVRGLNFDADSAFVVESSLKNDTIYYWLRDSSLINQDTLRMEVQYMMTDTTELLISKTDTLDITPKESYEKRMKARQREIEAWQKDQDKKKKRGEPYDSVMPREMLRLKINPSGSLSPASIVTIESPTPLLRLDTAAIHLYTKIDTLWYDADYTFKPSPDNIRRYTLTADWKPDTEYSLEIDSAAFEDIYGTVIGPVKQGMKVKSEDDFSTLTVNLSGIEDTVAVILQLLNNSEAVVAQVSASDGKAEFDYLEPGRYYLRAFVDSNGNGRWDTGDYAADRQAEAVYYYHEETECKAKWDVTRNWNLTSRRRFEQKPSAITKQKPDKEKKLKNRNQERAKQLGKEYIEGKTGVRL
ncbi:MAG: Ig-like domain-containing protein [Prevotella sp.]|nr:Ig-like domain-containing protein [Prevotella sp.]